MTRLPFDNGPQRLHPGLDIDPSRSLGFTFEGQPMTGHPGDTLASALLANGVRMVGRSFKYHRPRGIYGAGVEEPNATVDAVLPGGRRVPNLRATGEPLTDGMALEAVNAWPTLKADLMGVFDRFARFLPAGFYYKMFKWPRWETYEGMIRRAAGLGRMAFQEGVQLAPHRHRAVDLLVVGAGPAGLSCAHAAAAAGLSVMVVDDQPHPGGSLLVRNAMIAGQTGRAWAETQVAAIEAAGGTVLARSTAFAVWDHGMVGVLQRGVPAPPGEDHRWTGERLWLVRAAQTVVAAGAIERPLVFAHNDRPGVMSAWAIHSYLARYGVLAGRRVVLASTQDSVAEAARALAAVGAEVTVVDRRAEAPTLTALETAGVAVRLGVVPLDTRGGRGLTQVQIGQMDGTNALWLDADVLGLSGGWTPSVHLHCQAGGKLRWDDATLSFVPAEPLAQLAVAGAAAGLMPLQAALDSGHGAGVRVAQGLGRTAPDRSPQADTPPVDFQPAPAWPRAQTKHRAWVDFQNDVTTKDLSLAVQESFRSIEHVKRYTTLGMATDQGKTSNINGLALVAELTGQPIAQVGTTTYRPPYTPVSLGTLAGMRQRHLEHPVRRLPLEARHRALGAAMREYGGWLRPAFYGPPAEEKALQQAEAAHARRGLSLFDGSSLGKIEVLGPAAADLLSFVYYNTIRTLRPGRARYGFILTEAGIVYDDGVLVRLGEDHWIVSASSSHTAGVLSLLEEWRQDRFAGQPVAVHNTTTSWATLSVTGTGSQALVAGLGSTVDLSDAALPPMGVAQGQWRGRPVRIARVSFTGERGYEISVPAGAAVALWDALMALGEPQGLRPLGLEALSLLRAEKGYIIIGKDTDGTTMPHDLGMTGPRQKKTAPYIGQRSLFTEAAQDPNRRQFVGFEPVIPGAPPLPVGAHIVEGPRQPTGARHSAGYISSSYHSPTLGRAFALGHLENGRRRFGEVVEVQHLKTTLTARVVPPCFLDPEGEKLRG